MGCYLYCIGAAPLTAPTVEGLDGAAVSVVEAAALAALVSSAAARPLPSIERVRQHDRAIRAVTSNDATPLPARFGQWFATRDALAGRLREGAEGYRRALEAIRGTLEFSVQASLQDPEPEPATRSAGGSGTAYMEALAKRAERKRAARARELRIAEDLAGRLGPVIRRWRLVGDEKQRRWAPPPMSDSVTRRVSMAHLVPTTEIARYREEVSRYARANPALDVRVSGPWPPYSFAE